LLRFGFFSYCFSGFFGLIDFSVFLLNPGYSFCLKIGNIFPFYSKKEEEEALMIVIFLAHSILH
jgi:hypothetical protein